MSEMKNMNSKEGNGFCEYIVGRLLCESHDLTLEISQAFSLYEVIVPSTTYLVLIYTCKITLTHFAHFDPF